MAKNILWGVAGGALVVALAYVTMAKLRGGETAPITATAKVIAAPAAIDERPDTLELRGVGLRIDVWAQTDLWHFLKAQKDPHVTVLSRDPKDYPDNPTSVGDKSTRGLGSAFKYSAGEGVERWPIPVIIFGPPWEGEQQGNPASYISSNRQQASLGIHLFTWVQAVNVANPQAQIDYLFDFFEKNPTVPEALIYGMDGLRIRSGFGGKDIAPGRYVPSQFDAMAGLLVSRTDRVDRYMRPYVTDDPEDADTDDTKYDSIKLWNFFWQYTDSQVSAGDDTGMPQEQAWRKQLPTLWKTLSNQGPGHFVPSDWYPVRWARWQLAEFDDAPMLGYLHRPVTVNLNDEQGTPLRGTAKTDALRVGWGKVQAQLPQGEKIGRLFFDSTDQPALQPLLHTLDAPGSLDPTSPTEGFDVGHRLGNLGIMGPMVGIGLSAMASYDLGQGSVTVNSTQDGRWHFILVTPPTSADKNKNTQERHLGNDPFVHLVPGD